MGLFPPLCSMVDDEVVIQNENAKVAEMVLEDGSWDFNAFNSVVPDDVSEWIRGIHPPLENSRDKLKWLGEQNGKFTVKSCYQKFMGEALGSKDDKWKLIWDWKGLERIRYFLWMVGHERLNTNSRRAVWCGCSALCVWCDNKEENTMHVLRDCRLAKEIWVRLLPDHDRVGFFSGNLWEWLELNLKRLSGTGKENWVSTFAVSCWLLWKWRNKRIFDPSFVMPSDPMKFIEWWVCEISLVNSKMDLLCRNKKDNQNHLLRW